MGHAGVHVDEGYADPWLARLYDAECPWHPQDDFYQALDLEARSVLDVGCGTGTRLVSTRERGHTGELVGVDPAAGMLGVARGKSDRVEWIERAAQMLDLRRRFDLITMTGHAFQVLLDDDAMLAALTAFHDHLSAGGLLAFETRNPGARAWEGWVADRTHSRIESPDGERFEVWVDEPNEVPPDLVSFTSFTRSLHSDEVRTSHSTLRFVDPQHLRELLARARFEVEGWFGDWDRTPVGPTSPEVIVRLDWSATMSSAAGKRSSPGRSRSRVGGSGGRAHSRQLRSCVRTGTVAECIRGPRSELGGGVVRSGRLR